MSEFKDKKPKYQGWKLLNEDGVKNERARQAARKEAAIKNANGRPTNAAFAAQNDEFKAACQEAGVEATARQASKYLRKRGRAWAAHLSMKNAQVAV
jgi:hypothetical protein